MASLSLSLSLFCFCFERKKTFFFFLRDQREEEKKLSINALLFFVSMFGSEAFEEKKLHQKNDLSCARKSFNVLQQILITFVLEVKQAFEKNIPFFQSHEIVESRKVISWFLWEPFTIHRFFLFLVQRRKRSRYSLNSLYRLSIFLGMFSPNSELLISP